jgi:hypothetical protein
MSHDLAAPASAARRAEGVGAPEATADDIKALTARIAARLEGGDYTNSELAASDAAEGIVGEIISSFQLRRR